MQREVWWRREVQDEAWGAGISATAIGARERHVSDNEFGKRYVELGTAFRGVCCMQSSSLRGDK